VTTYRGNELRLVRTPQPLLASQDNRVMSRHNESRGMIPWITIAAFGTTSLVAGIITLLRPATTLSTLQLPASAIGAVYGNGLAALAMGIYYNLMAYQNNRAFFIATVPMRMLTTMVFWSLGGPWRAPAAWEGLGAFATGLALILE
jgi:hypothetical protein